MSRKMLVADLLCGAGGSSTGALRAFQRSSESAYVASFSPPGM